MQEAGVWVGWNFGPSVIALFFCLRFHLHFLFLVLFLLVSGLLSTMDGRQAQCLLFGLLFFGTLELGFIFNILSIV